MFFQNILRRKKQANSLTKENSLKICHWLNEFNRKCIDLQFIYRSLQCIFLILITLKEKRLLVETFEHAIYVMTVITV